MLIVGIYTLKLYIINYNIKLWYVWNIIINIYLKASYGHLFFFKFGVGSSPKFIYQFFIDKYLQNIFKNQLFIIDIFIVCVNFKLNILNMLYGLILYNFNFVPIFFVELKYYPYTYYDTTLFAWGYSYKM